VRREVFAWIIAVIGIVNFLVVIDNLPEAEDHSLRIRCITCYVKRNEQSESLRLLRRTKIASNRDWKVAARIFFGILRTVALLI